jgi:hypothetical protein
MGSRVAIELSFDAGRWSRVDVWFPVDKDE